MGLLSMVIPLFRRAAVSAERDDDGSLVRRHARGDAEAFPALVDRYQAEVYGFLVRRLRDEARAEEFVQETFLRLVVEAPRWSADGPVRAWLFRVARNLSIDHLRRHGTRFENATTGDLDDPVLAEPDTALAPDDQVENARLRARLRKAVAQLPPEQREVVLLRHDEGLSFPEIGEVLDISPNTAKSRLRYALEALRGHLADLEPDRAHG